MIIYSCYKNVNNLNLNNLINKTKIHNIIKKSQNVQLIKIKSSRIQWVIAFCPLGEEKLA